MPCADSSSSTESDASDASDASDGEGEPYLPTKGIAQPAPQLGDIAGQLRKIVQRGLRLRVGRCNRG